MTQIILVLLLSFLLPTAKEAGKPIKLSQTEQWKLGWRMIFSNMEKDYTLGELQFDSLLATQSRIDKKFVLAGLEILNGKHKTEKVHRVLEQLDQETLAFICSKNQFSRTLANLEPCQPFARPEKVKVPALQKELIIMSINDQAARGNKKDELIAAYQLTTEEVGQNKGVFSTDEANRTRLKAIIAEYGFPTKQMVGADAMQGLFWIIQHADRDQEWQKSQLPNIEMAVQKGDMDGQSYAYLYDRIKRNAGEQQRYGTQFVRVDPKSKIAELAPTEDPENVDRRRMEIGMMPVDMYKKFMLRSVKN
jgi:hypothetical protein